MISLLMATYNGEEFITEQLISILNQTLLPDEVIICDDNSSDNTVEIIENFINQNRLDKHWKLYINKINKGYPRNFYYAIEKCNGEIIFFSDQDDLWEKDKIEKMYNIMFLRTDIKVLSCNYGLINEKSQIINSFMAPRKRNSLKTTNKSVNEILDKFMWPGMSMVIRRSFYHDILVNNDISLIAHDFALAMIAANINGFFYYDYLGVYHRRHDNNTAKEEHRISKLLNKKNKIDAIVSYNHMLYETIEKIELLEHSKESIVKKLYLSENRLKCIINRDLYKLFDLYIKNSDFRRIKSFISDILIILLNKKDKGT